MKVFSLHFSVPIGSARPLCCMSSRTDETLVFGRSLLVLVGGGGDRVLPSQLCQKWALSRFAQDCMSGWTQNTHFF